MNSIKIFITGVTTGVVCMLLISLFLKPADLKKTFKYVKLKQDLHIENTGYLKRGTIMRIDKPMDEGFTRYILYLNLKIPETIENYEAEHFQQVIPYWLDYSDSLR